MRVVSFRLSAVFLVLCAMLAAVSAADAAVVVQKPGEQRTRVLPGGQLPWDRALRNEFGWLFASPKIPTACATGRGDFAASVAQQVCGVVFSKERPRQLAPLSFAGGGGGSGSGNPDPLFMRMAGTGLGAGTQRGQDGTTVVPLPAAGWLLVSGLAGLAALRRRRSTPSALPR